MPKGVWEMKRGSTRQRAGLVIALLAFAARVGAGRGGAARARPSEFAVSRLVSDQPGVAPVLDPDLVNPWGLTSSSASPWWVSDNGTDKSTLYNGGGAKQGLVVSVAGGPTGTVFNPTAGFALPTGGKALFLVGRPGRSR